MSSSGQGGPQNPSRLTLLAKELGPWTPDIDPRRSEKPQIIDGQNFQDGIDGPISAFSSNFVNLNSFDTATRAKINELKIDNDILYGTPTGVYRLDSSSLVAWNILSLTVTNTYWPWTIAKVGGFFYLAQYDLGLWQYDPVNLTIKQIVTPSGQKIRYLAKSFGRLLYFDDTVIAQSALDDGTNFIPNLATAAGAQALSIVGGTPYRIEELADGFIVLMSEGTIKATYTTQSYVFAYGRLGGTAVKLQSPNAAVYVPQLGGVITLDSNGFYLTREYNYSTYGFPQPWEVEKSDYIKKNILSVMDFTKLGCIGMFYSQAMQMVFIYFAGNLNQGFFQTTFCYDLVSKKWGSFNEPHYGIFETYNYNTAVYSCSYMDQNGYMKAFSSANFSEDYPDDNTVLADYIYRPLLGDRAMVQIISSTPAVNGGNAFYEVHSEIKFSDRAPWIYNQFTNTDFYIQNSAPYSDTFFNLYDFTMDPTQNPMICGSNINFDFSGALLLFAVYYIINESGLNSYITIGPFRLNDQVSWAEETSAIESIILGMQSLAGFTIFEDWNIISGAEDYNSESGTDDWGAGQVIPNTYELTLRDTNDGVSSPFWGDEMLTAYLDNGSSQLYKPAGNSSIYHNLTISATNVNEAYALKIIDITAQFTGTQVGI